MRIWVILGVIGLLAIVSGCSKKDTVKQTAELDRLAWLLGRWEMVEEDHTLCEEWHRIDSVSFGGFGSRIAGTDTTQTEGLEIRATDSGVFYIADVPQNPEPVAFRLTESTDSSAVFENPEHDLPNLISYRLETTDIIRVQVSGIRDGSPTGFELLFARVSTPDPAAVE